MTKKQEQKGALAPLLKCQGANPREQIRAKKYISLMTSAKLKHLQNLAIWTGTEGSVSPLSALFGRRLAANSEAAGVPLDPALFPCKRCETILQSGYNCTIQTTKSPFKTRSCKKSSAFARNNILFICHFCSYRNLQMSTQKGPREELLTSSPPSVMISKPRTSADVKPGNIMKGLTGHGEVQNGRPESISLNSKSFSPAECICPGENAEPTKKTGALLSTQKNEANMSGSDSGGSCSAMIDSGSVLVGSQKKKKSISILKEIATCGECARKHNTGVEDLVNFGEKKGNILAKMKRKTKPSVSDRLPCTGKSSVTISSDKALAPSGKRRKLALDTKESSGCEEHQSVSSVCTTGSPTTPPETCSSKLSKKQRQGSVLGSDKQPICASCLATPDTGKTAGQSSKRKRKSWQSLKKIAEREKSKSPVCMNKLAISFPMCCMARITSPDAKKKETRDKRQKLDKHSKLRKVDKVNKKVSLNNIPDTKGHNKGKEGQSIRTSVTSSSDDRGSCVQLADAMDNSQNRNLVRPSNCLSTMTDARFLLANQNSSLSSALQSPVAFTGHHIFPSSEWSNVAGLLPTPVMAVNLAGLLPSPAMVGPSLLPTPVMAVNVPGLLPVMAANQFHWLSQVSNINAVLQAPVILTGHQQNYVGQGDSTSALLQSPFVTAGQQFHSLLQGPNSTYLRPFSATLAAHQFHNLSQGSMFPSMQQSSLDYNALQIRLQ